MTPIDIVNRVGFELDTSALRQKLKGDIRRMGHSNIVKSVAQGAQEMGAGLAAAVEKRQALLAPARGRPRTFTDERQWKLRERAAAARGQLCRSRAVALDPSELSDTLGAPLKYQDDIARVQGAKATALINEVRAEIRAGDGDWRRQIMGV